MAFTDPNNLIDPELLTDYAAAQYFEGIRVVRTGILEEINIEGLAESSSIVEMPQWEIIQAGQTLTPGNEITLGDLNDHKERHPVVRRYNGIENLDLARIISKGNPNEEVGRQIATSVARDYNRSGIATLQGCAAANTGNVIADTGAVPAITDITSLEGVFGDILEQVMVNGTGILAMQSNAYRGYKALGLVSDPTVGDALQDDIVSGARFTGFRGQLLGHMIVVDDEIFRAGLTSKTTGDLLTYLVGVGALKSAMQRQLNVEQDRSITRKSDQITWDVHRSLGVRGMDYTATVNKRGPEDTDLRTSGNWALVAEDAKLVPVASIQTSPAA